MGDSEGFRILKAQLVNVGSLRSLYVDLGDKPVLAFLGPNGVGKTTLLEALSLLGHAPVFPYVEFGDQDGVRNSPYRSAVGQEELSAPPAPKLAAFLAAHKVQRRDSLLQWAMDLTPAEDEYVGVVAMEVEIPGNGTIDIAFLVDLEHAATDEKQEFRTLTPLLSQTNRGERRSDTDLEASFLMLLSPSRPGCCLLYTSDAADE